MTKTKETMIKKLGSEEAYKDWMKSNASKGGKAGVGNPRGFALNHDLAVAAAKKAGMLSKRGRRYVKTEGGYNYYVNLKSGATEKYKR